MRTAPPVFSFTDCAICLKFVDNSAILRVCPLYRLLTLPLACFLAPIPPPALAERSSRREGGDYKFILPGASPPAPRHQTVYGTDSPCRRCAPRAACVLVAGSPCHCYTRRGGANKAGTLKIHRAADRRQAAGRSSRAEYSEVPGMSVRCPDPTVPFLLFCLIAEVLFAERSARQDDQGKHRNHTADGAAASGLATRSAGSGFSRSAGSNCGGFCGRTVCGGLIGMRRLRFGLRCGLRFCLRRGRRIQRWEARRCPSRTPRSPRSGREPRPARRRSQRSAW